MLLRRIQADKVMLLTTLALLSFGLVMVYSSSSILALGDKGDAAYFLKRQAVWAGLGLMGMLALWKSDYRKLRKPSLLILVAVAVALVVVIIPGVSAPINGARRWFRIGSLSLQPSEFAKPALILFFAASLAARGGKLRDFKGGLLPYLLILCIFALLIGLEPDFGTAATLAVVAVTMLYVSGARTAHLVALGLASLPVIYYQLFHVGFRVNRIKAFLDPWSDPLGAGYQTIQSFLALGCGGLTGVGLGQSRQKLLFLPEAHNDFIFSIIGEEFGLGGSLTTAFLFIVFIYCGLRIALSCEDAFGRNLAFGLTFMLGFQSLINMGVATGLFPNKGMPLPFISTGGTAVFVALLSVGLVLSVARIRRQDSGEPVPARR